MYTTTHIRNGLSLSLLLLVALLGGCGQLDLAIGPLLHAVRVTPEEISPNADGQQDVTQIFYSLRRTATVSIYFDNDAGERFYFRRDRRRSPGDYDVQWGGVVDQPRTVQTSYGPQEILSQVLPDGHYRWTVAAVDDRGQRAETTGTITLRDGDTVLPELHNFAVVPQSFTPNQDSIDDRVSISYSLNKDVAKILVYLTDPANPNTRFILPEKPALVKPEEAGYHEYDYDGGVDLNAEPPPDGRYQVVGEARDAAGNAVRVVRELTISEGGKPRADVAQGEIEWAGEMNRVVFTPLGDKLCFKTIVTNEGTVPIRTTGPWPGQTYYFTENSNTLAARGQEAWYQQAGVWRFGINFDTTGVDFPFRWAVGRQQDLERRIDDRGREQWYLLPGKSGEVSGCIVMNEAPPKGTNFWWGGLIHEFVAVVNNNIDRISVQVGEP